MIGLLLALFSALSLLSFAFANIYIRKGMYCSGESFSGVVISLFLGTLIFGLWVFLSGKPVQLASLSWLGLKASPQALTYSITKAALIMLTRSLAVHLGKDGIRVNAICPGPVDTTALYQEMAATQENPKRTIEERPIPRYGTVEEMAQAALFLASPESAYVTGVALPVDGGGVAK